jgi:hypothetical protein
MLIIKLNHYIAITSTTSLFKLRIKKIKDLFNNKVNKRKDKLSLYRFKDRSIMLQS